MSLFNSLENGFENGYAKYQRQPATGFSITVETSKPQRRTQMCLEEKTETSFPYFEQKRWDKLDL